MGFGIKATQLIRTTVLLLSSISAAFILAPQVDAGIVIGTPGGLGVIKGVVRDDGGSPISDATVAIFRSGTSTLLKQVTSAADGSFLAKILPGTYTVLAVAQGFNPMTLFGVEVSRSAELTYGFRLERAGAGNTLPEKRADRNSSKWRIRAAQSQRSIYQDQEGKIPLENDSAAKNETAELDLTAGDAKDKSSSRKGQSVVETYFAGSSRGNYAGVNAATLIPVGERAQLAFAGQTGAGRNAPQRFVADIKFQPLTDHQLRINSSIGRLGSVASNKGPALGQFSFQATDEWKVREGIIFVFGVDYSRFIGAASDWSASPRLGLQYDINSKTRVRTAFTSQTEQKSWANALDLEGVSIAFAEPVAVEDLVVENGKRRMNTSRRLEFGVERVIDGRSSIAANAFFDTTIGRGVGLNGVVFDALGGESFNEFVADQQGSARGVSIVYARRLNSLFSTSAGYSLGTGQKLSAAALSDPAHIFESDFFQSFFGQFDAELRSGTSIKTIFRLSPKATVFAIDPFKERLAIYDPGLSVLITQSLPTLGLPLRAEVIVDARNLFDFQSGIFGDEGSLRLNAQRRMLRGGIQVRF